MHIHYLLYLLSSIVGNIRSAKKALEFFDFMRNSYVSSFERQFSNYKIKINLENYFRFLVT